MKGIRALRRSLSALTPRQPTSSKAPERYLSLRVLGVLRHRDARWWFLAQAFKNLYLFTFVLAEVWLVVTLTGSGLWVGLTVGAPALAVVLFAPLGGVLGDRPGRRLRLLIWWTVMTALAAVLCIAAAVDVAVPALVCAIAFLRGTADALQAPTRWTMQAAIVRREGIQQGTALSAVTAEMAIVGSGAIAGLLLEPSDVTVALAVASAFGLAAVVGLVAVDPRIETRSGREWTTVRPAPVAARASGRLTADLLAAIDRFLRSLAIAEVRANFRLWVPLVTLAILFGLAINTQTLVPLSVHQTWSDRPGLLGLGGPELLGLLMALYGAGKLAGALWAAARGAASGEMLLGATLGIGLACLAAMVPASIWLAGAMLALGFAEGVAAFAIAAIVQSWAGAVRGRVSALYMVLGLGPKFVGALVAGGLAAIAGPHLGWGFAAIAALAAGVLVVVACLRAVRRDDAPPA